MGEVFLILVAVGFVLIAPVLALIALVRGESVRRRAALLEDDVRTLSARLAALNRRLAGEAAGAAPAVSAPGPVPPAPVPVAPMPVPAAVPPAPRPDAPAVPPPVAAPTPGVPPAAVAPLLPPSPARPRRPMPPIAVADPSAPRPPAPRGPDFATNLGPRLLIATGALACVVFLALFVKYAWENDWVGPSGRVLMGTATGVALVAGGLRLRHGRYRPLGQGLAGTGLAGLYLSAFAANAFYDLIPRPAAFAWMLAITISAVLLAARLDVRLMAALAWIGGYLTPVLLATGEDRALALFAYLALLDVGALVLDRRRPWPETAPLAILGTVFLYVGWWVRFFNPERFDVAAFGVVLFTALFVAGLTRKDRQIGVGVSLFLGGCGVFAMAALADRPVPLLLMSLAFAAVALLLRDELRVAAGVLALMIGFLPLLAWGLSFYRAESFGVAAAWSMGALLLMLAAPELRLGAAREQDEDRPGWLDAMLVAALGAAGIASTAMAASSDLPGRLALLLLALAGVAIVARRRAVLAELVGLAFAALTVTVWMGVFYKDGRGTDALMLVLPVAGAYLVSLITRGLVQREPLGPADVFTHAGVATLVWGVLFRVLYQPAPGALALASIALAALYLVLGLAARRVQPEAVQVQVRTCLGLATVFITLAIPVRLGLHGITLAWAFEGVVLLALGLRFGSALGRAGAYLVLGLAVIRLFGWHTTQHAGEVFRPIFNQTFGTWMAVIVSLGVAALLVRRSPVVADLDRVAAGMISVAALVMLFGLLTSETHLTFARAASDALARGDAAALEAARLLGKLAISVLWTVFSTALLATGLGLRNRPLFYAAYGLFALTALKVVFVDLATLHTIYRMFSFLALGLLLLAGAYLNLRFRERMMPSEEAA